MLWIAASLLVVLFIKGAMAREIDRQKVEFGIAMSFAGPVHVASDAATGPAVISAAAAPDTVGNATGRSRETLRGVVASVDERNDRISVRLAPDATADLKVRDGLLFNAVRYGDQVEVTVENIDGAKTIVGLVKE
jgi:Cu/Ag efflux protein CusF